MPLSTKPSNTSIANQEQTFNSLVAALSTEYTADDESFYSAVMLFSPRPTTKSAFDANEALIKQLESLRKPATP